MTQKRAQIAGVNNLCGSPGFSGLGHNLSVAICFYPLNCKFRLSTLARALLHKESGSAAPIMSVWLTLTHPLSSAWRFAMASIVPRSLDSFRSRKTLTVDGEAYEYFSLLDAENNGLPGISALPFSLKVLLENLLRFEDGQTVSAADIRAWMSSTGLPAPIRKMLTNQS